MKKQVLFTILILMFVICNAHAQSVAVTGDVINVSYSSATIECYSNIPNDGETFFIGIMYSTEEIITEDNSVVTKKLVTNANKGNHSFSIEISELDNAITYYYKAYVQLYSNGEYYYGETKTLKLKPINLTKGNAIDMGVSVMWASTNLGAESPEDDGGYYAYGEIEEKDSYFGDNYKYYDAGSNEYIELGDNISGNKYFDAATAILGDDWRMPTYDEYKELKENSIFAIVTYKGKMGFVVESTINGNSIFMPYSGVKNGSRLDDYNRNGIGCYWTGTKGVLSGYGESFNHWDISFYGFGNPFGIGNPSGISIRPVYTRTNQDEKKQCATPTITIKDGKLSFSCETEGVIFCYSVTPPSSFRGEGNEVSLSPKYTISVYAKKDGYVNSETVTKEIDVQGQNGPQDVNGDGIVDTQDVLEIYKYIQEH